MHELSRYHQGHRPTSIRLATRPNCSDRFGVGNARMRSRALAEFYKPDADGATVTYVCGRIQTKVEATVESVKVGYALFPGDDELGASITFLIPDGRTVRLLGTRVTVQPSGPRGRDPLHDSTRMGEQQRALVPGRADGRQDKGVQLSEISGACLLCGKSQRSCGTTPHCGGNFPCVSYRRPSGGCASDPIPSGSPCAVHGPDHLLK